MAKRKSQQSTLRSADQPRYHYTYLEHQKPAVNAVVDVFRGIPFAQYYQLSMYNPKSIAGYEPAIMRYRVYGASCMCTSPFSYSL